MLCPRIRGGFVSASGETGIPRRLCPRAAPRRLCPRAAPLAGCVPVLPPVLPPLLPRVPVLRPVSPLLRSSFLLVLLARERTRSGNFQSDSLHPIF